MMIMLWLLLLLLLKQGDAGAARVTPANIGQSQVEDASALL